MKKIFLGVFVGLLFLYNTVFASGGHGEGEAYFIILVTLFLHIILLIALIISTSNLPKSINYYKSFFVFSVFLYLVWGTWYLYYGFFDPIGDIIFDNKYDFMGILGVFSLLLPILCVLLIIFFRKKIHNLMEKYSKIVYIFLYFILPIIMLILSMLLLKIELY